MDNDEDLQKVLDAINGYFGNTKRSKEETRSGLRSLISDIETMIESLGIDDD